MNVLLLSMPDSFEHMPPVAIRMPNGALASLAGNVDPHHHVADRRSHPGARHQSGRRSSGWSARPGTGRRRPVGDDVSARDGVEDRAAGASAPAVGPRRGRRLRSQPRVRRVHTVAGHRLHRPRRRRADAVRAAARARKRAVTSRASPGLSYRTPDGFSHNRGPRRRAARVERAAAAQPRRARAARLHAARTARSTSSKRRAAAPTTAASARSSRCAAATFTRIPIDRVLADIADARAHGAEAIFLVDDNITLDIERFERCATRSSTPASTTSTTSCRR